MPKVATRVDADAVLAALAERPAGEHHPDAGDGRILDAAGRLLVDVGLEDLEVDQVAELAGVGRSTVYRRFDGRNALLARRSLTRPSGSSACGPTPWPGSRNPRSSWWRGSPPACAWLG